MNLLELQRRMAEDVRRPLTPDLRMQAATEDGTATADSIAEYIKPNPELSSLERLEIYNRQYWFRVIEAVSEDYPALNAVLGAERFDALILAYLRENPSTSFSLRNLGSKLPAWLGDHPEFTGARHDLSVDVARLEWAYIEAFDSATLPPMSASEFLEIVPSTVLQLQPHLQLLELRYPADELVLAVHHNAPKADIVSNAVAERKQARRIKLPSLRRSTVYLAIHRYDNSVYYRRIEREGFWLLSAIRSGHSIESAVALVLAQSKWKITGEQAAVRIRDCFAHASELGWVSRGKTEQRAG